MKVLDLAKEFDVTTKELITFFKENGFKVSSHMQKVTDEMYVFAKKNFEPSNQIKEEDKTEETVDVKKVVEKTILYKAFAPDEEIPCKSVTPWKLIAPGVDKNTIYSWNNFGDIEYLKFRDLQALRKTEYVTKPKFLIMDENLREQWKRELDGVYKYFENIDYPEEFFDIPDDEFINLLKTAPSWLSEIIKSTAISMIKNENYPSIGKIKIIDDMLGTCIKEFI
ncbi:translation initiation factor IF-2 N-terminal domain-containing protein [Clostridium sp. AF22-10]|jgi:hypothetical protein|uniref:translation initiation factor IF-2 N-terminal domain-containing protein n=1 Tax=Clostridium sp. AF22-10 TaxID=2293004 RepID=UPI001FAA1D72|nr:MAG TPA: translation initiation factor IF-2 [Bacteriophage sp.]